MRMKCKKFSSSMRDMTTGKPWALLLEFAVPLMFGNLFQQVYTVVDTLIVSRVLGINALAAIGVTEWAIFLMFASIQGIVQGFSIIMAQCFGAGDDSRLRRSVYNGFCLILMMLTVFTIAGQFFVGPVLKFLHTPDEIAGLAADYLRFIYMGIPLVFVYNYLAAVLRSIGNTRIPLQAVVISSVVNMILDILFVYGFGWGMRGAAAATLTAMLTSAVFCYIKLKKFELLRLQKSERKVVFDIMAEQLKLGIPMGLQNVITSVGGLIVQSVINGFGVTFIAGYTAANKLYGLLETAASSYGYAMNTFVGQNRGAGRSGRLKKGLLSGNILGIITAYGMSAVMVLFGKQILGCFIAGTAEEVNAAVRGGYHFLLILAAFFPFLYMLYITRAWVQGMGTSAKAMISSLVQLAMRVGFALLGTRYLGAQAVYWGEAAAWIGADVFLFSVYAGIISARVRSE